MIFVIPWREFSLVGTTDTDFDGDLDRLYATRRRGELPPGRGAPGACPTRAWPPTEVVYTYAGVRPLSFEEGKRRVRRLARPQGRRGGAGGRFLSITGTKLTCFRSLAEELGDRVMRALGRAGPGRGRPRSRSTAPTTRRAASRRARGSTCRRDGGDGASPARRWRSLVDDLRPRLPRACSSWPAKVPDGTERLCPSNPDDRRRSSTTRCSDELAVSLQDVLLRRTGIGTSRCQGLDCAESIGAPHGAAPRLVARAGSTPSSTPTAARGPEPAVPGPLIRAIVRPAWRNDAQTSRARNAIDTRLR